MSKSKLEEIKEWADKNGHVMVAIGGWASWTDKKNVERTIPNYRTFQTYEKYLEWYEKLKKPTIGVCEVTWQEQPMRAHLDMDDKREDEVIARQPILDAVEKIKQRVVAMGLRSTEWEPAYVVAVGSRYLTAELFKYSVHVVFLNLSFVGRDHLRYFMQPICDEIKMIDQSIYKSGKSQAFRFPGSVKWSDSSRTPLKPHPRWSTQEPCLADFIIGNPEPESIVKFDLPPTTQKRKIQRQHKSVKIQRVECDDKLIADIKYFLCSSRVELKNGDTYYVHKPRCPIAGRVHGNNNGYCKELYNNVYYWCFNDECKKKGKYFLFSP